MLSRSLGRSARPVRARTRNTKLTSTSPLRKSVCNSLTGMCWKPASTNTLSSRLRWRTQVTKSMSECLRVNCPRRKSIAQPPRNQKRALSDENIAFISLITINWVWASSSKIEPEISLISSPYFCFSLFFNNAQHQIGSHPDHKSETRKTLRSVGSP
jgi:hypothetical protein